MTLLELAKKLRMYIEKASISLEDTDALEAVELFPQWNGDSFPYKVGDRVRENNILYKCLQDHSSLPSWSPSAAPSLWARVLIPDPDIVPDWIQPDSANPYMKGDRVRYNDKVWESTIDNNVWAPGTGTLWIEVNET